MTDSPLSAIINSLTPVHTTPVDRYEQVPLTPDGIEPITAVSNELDKKFAVDTRTEYAIDPYVPQGSGSVASSRFFNEIIDKLLMGATAKHISTWLLEEKGERLAESNIYRYMRRYISPLDAMPPEQVTRMRASLRKFGGQLDALEGIRALSLAQETRVGKMVELEYQRQAGKGAFAGMPEQPQYFDPRIKGNIELLYTMFRDQVNTEIALGRIKNVDGKQAIPPDIMSKKTPITIDARRIVHLNQVLNILESGEEHLKGVNPPAPPPFIIVHKQEPE